MLFIGENVGSKMELRSTSPSIRSRDDTLRKEHAWRDRNHGNGARSTLLNAPDVYMEKIAIGPDITRVSSTRRAGG